MSAARALVPFVRLSYAQPSQCSWFDEDGAAHTDPSRGRARRPSHATSLSIGIQGVLEEVATHLEDGEQFCAFLDDVCLLL